MNNLVLNQIFTKATFDSLLYDRKDDRKIRYDVSVKRFVKNEKSLTNEEIITEIYSYLEQNYRNEYFYKNTIKNKILLDNHSLDTTAALTELPVNKSVVDYVIINGEATAYEIKSDLDSFERLENQIRDYQRAFKDIYLVTSNKKLEEAYAKLKNTGIGIYVVNENNEILAVKESKSTLEYLSHEVMFKILRKPEFEKIIKAEFHSLPVTSDFTYYQTCLSLIKTIEIEKFYYLFIEQLKNRIEIDNERYCNLIPYELKFLMYYYLDKNPDYEAVNRFLNEKWRG